MSESEEAPITTDEKEEPAPLVNEAKLEEIITPETEEIDPDAEISVHATMEKAIDNYRKIKETKYEIDSTGKKSALCKEHYKEWKKATKDDRSLERARYDRD